MRGMSEWGQTHGGVFGWLAEKMRGDAGPATHPKLRGDLQQHFTTEGIAKALGLPAHAEGTMRVPRTGLALIHRGEEITPAHRARFGARPFGARPFGARGDDDFTAAGRDLMQMGGTGELMIEQRRIWELYWRGFNRVGADYLRSGGGAGAGPGGYGMPGGGATSGVGSAPIGGRGIGRIMFGGIAGQLMHGHALSFAPPFSGLGGGGGALRLPGGMQLPGGITMPGGGMGLRFPGGFMPPQLGRRHGGIRHGFAHGGGGGRVAMPDVPANVTGNAYVAAARARFAAELKDPQKRMQFAGMLLSEGTALPTAESAMNRSLYKGTSLMQMLHSGFYGPINRGQLPAFMRRLQNNPALMAKMNRAINAALGGSDTIHGATDQGMLSDPNGRWPGGRTMIGGQVFNDWGGGPGGHAGAARWRQEFERRAAANAVTNADRAAVNGAAGGVARVEGSGSLSVDVRAPRGTSVQAKGGGIFQSVRLRRDVQLPTTQTGPVQSADPYQIPD